MLLHNQGLLESEEEIRGNVNELRKQMNNVLYLAIMPTEACNFRCPYCYEDHAPATMEPKILWQIKQFVAECIPRFESVRLGWFGGEPTLCKDTVLDFSQYMQSLGLNHPFELEMSMTTNGYLLDVDSFKQYFQAGIKTYQITLDGWNHDTMRPHISGCGTMETILRNLEEIVRLNPKEYDYHIVLRHNVLAGDEDLSWYDHLSAMTGNDARFTVAISPVSDWGGSTVRSLRLLGKDDADASLKKRYEYLDSIGLRADRPNNAPLSRICYAAYPYSYVFRANGKIEKCTVALDAPQNCIGEVNPDTGVTIDAKANQVWCHSEVKSECLTCRDLLSCLNMQCGRLEVVLGDTRYCHRACTANT